MDNTLLNKEMNVRCGTKDIDFFNPETGLSNIFKYVIEPSEIESVDFDYASNCVTCSLTDYQGETSEATIWVDSIEEARKKSKEALITACHKALCGGRYANT